MKPRHKRLALIAGGVSLLGLSAALLLSAFQKNLVFFFTPTQIVAGDVPRQHSFRVGGLVEVGSLKRASDGLSVSFVVTDLVQRVHVTYHGLLPDLFREGKGVVAQGRVDSNNEFQAEQVLAKHDENYMPPEAKYSIEHGKTGVRQAVEPNGVIVDAPSGAPK